MHMNNHILYVLKIHTIIVFILLHSNRMPSHVNKLFLINQVRNPNKMHNIKLDNYIYFFVVSKIIFIL